jgi:hypothetical protein
MTCAPDRDPDWRAMFAKYIRLVVMCEGVDFMYEEDWTPAEWAAIQGLEEDP